MPALTVQPRARLFHGHVWVYATEIKGRFGEPKPGDVVQLQDVRGKPLGSAIYNPQSQISARLFSYRRQPLDLEFFIRRLERARQLREQAGVDMQLCRLVWSESDGLPGVVVDRYGDYLVLQTLTLAMAQRQEMIVEALQQVFSPRGIAQRNEGNVRRAEGLEQVKGMIFGELPAPFTVRHGGSSFQVDLLEGQKTGLYLDQLDNYQQVARLAQGRRVLDCFSNQGGFAQACSLAGAAEVTAVDVSESAVAQIAQNSVLSGARIQGIAANCFDYLKQQESAGAEYDLIILDPPSFTKTKASMKDALRGYKEIHLRALKMLRPGGILATFSCSHHVSRGDFHGAIADAAVDTRKTLRRIATYSQPPDHPILATIPETEYLTGYAYEVVTAW
jgi:23S rRNA (cytosine1962-C5)-methyltransferase